MAFDIRVHDAQGVIEVIYPPEPSHVEVADYLVRMKRAIDGRGGPWKCLVDQRSLKLLEPALLERIATLNAYAQAKGMTRSARVVASSVAALQARRIAESAALSAPVRTFGDRETALAWLDGVS